jgi:hypothetical protein
MIVEVRDVVVIDEKHHLLVSFDSGDAKAMLPSDLRCIVENTTSIITDVIWNVKSNPPSWLIEQKRKCVFANSTRARESFGFNDRDIAGIAAVFTNNMSKPIDIIGWLCEDATPGFVANLGLARKIVLMREQP